MNSTELVKINVGGQLFITSKNTVSNAAMIKAALEFPGFLEIQEKSGIENPTLYFDKDPNIFSYVLNILRGDITAQNVPKNLIDQVLKQLDYFGADVEIVVPKEKPYRKRKKVIDLEREIQDTIFRCIRYEEYKDMRNEIPRVFLQKGKKVAGIRFTTSSDKTMIEYHFTVKCICDEILSEHLRTYKKWLALDERIEERLPLSITILKDCILEFKANLQTEIEVLLG